MFEDKLRRLNFNRTIAALVELHVSVFFNRMECLIWAGSKYLNDQQAKKHGSGFFVLLNVINMTNMERLQKRIFFFFKNGIPLPSPV